MATDQTMDPYRTESSTSEQMQQQAQQVAQQAKETAQKATNKAQQRMRTELDTRTARAGGQVQSTAEDLRSVAEELRNQGKDMPARLAEQGADRVEQVARYLMDSDADKMLSDIEDFGRRQPWAVVAGGMVLGFVASRFLKASSSRRYSDMYQWRVPASDVRYSSGQLPAYTTGGTSSSMSPGATPVEGYEETYTERVYTEGAYDDGTGATYTGGV
jgi:hypothetical protein